MVFAKGGIITYRRLEGFAVCVIITLSQRVFSNSRQCFEMYKITGHLLTCSSHRLVWSQPVFGGTSSPIKGSHKSCFQARNTWHFKVDVGCTFQDISGPSLIS